MADEPYIRVPRRFFTDPAAPWLNRTPAERRFSRAEAELDLYQMASWSDSRPWSLPSGAILLALGETPPVSTSYLARRWGWAANSVDRFMERKREEGSLAKGRKTAQGGTWVLRGYPDWPCASDPLGEPVGYADGGEDGGGRGGADGGAQTVGGQDDRATRGGARGGADEGSDEGSDEGTGGVQKKAGTDTGKKKGGRRARAAAPLPAEWTPNDKHRLIASEDGLDVEREAVKMRRWADANDVRRASWDGTFTNWLSKAGEDAGERGGGSAPRSPREFNGNELTWG